MKTANVLLATVGLGLLLGGTVSAATAPDPKADLTAFQAYFEKTFPKVAPKAFVNGPYNFSPSENAQWQQIMDFPPYELGVDNGKKLFETKFANGRDYASCFPNGGIGIAQTYPAFDPATGRVETLETALNACRAKNGQPPLSVTSDPLADIVAYMTDTSRGKPIAVVIPDDARAVADYEAGKQYFYTRRGQLNFSCASCHVQSAGKQLRGDMLAPALGLTAAFPIYRSAWGAMGTVERRFIECNQQVRSVPEQPDSDAYRNLAYFLAYMDNGLPVAGPGARP